MVYRSCVRSAMLYRSETWCLKESEIAIVRSMCGVKLVDRKKMDQLMEMLGSKETLDRMAKANEVRWYGHVIRRDDDNIPKKAMMLEVNGKRKRGRPKMTRRNQVEKSVKKVGLKIKEAADRTRWREGVRAMAEGMRCIRPPSGTRKKLDDDDEMIWVFPRMCYKSSEIVRYRCVLGYITLF